MQLSREQVLCNAGPCDHAAHLYTDDASIVEAVELFANAAIDRGEAVVLLATSEHLPGITQRLESDGRDCATLLSEGQLVCLDAEAALAAIMRGRGPDREAFESLVRPVIEAALDRFASLAAYGEFVNLLWQRGRDQAAHTLEEWWNDLITEYGFSLLCGYRVDVFDFRDSVQRGIDTICSTHTHLLPVAEPERLERAVSEAMREVFHNGDADALRRHLLTRCSRVTRMPPAQAALLALHDILPSLAQVVRMVARDYYRQAELLVK